MLFSLAACQGSVGLLDGTPGNGGSSGGGNSGGGATGSASSNGGGTTGSASSSGGGTTGGAATSGGGTTGGAGTSGGGTNGTGDTGGGNTSGTFTGGGMTVQGVFIPNNHPRLFWTDTRLAALKAYWAKHAFTPNNDQYSVLDQLYAYMATGNATYCNWAIGYSMGVDLSTCTADKAGCDDARWYGETAILTYDWCYSVMTDAQRTTFRNNWNKWLAAIDMETWGGVGMSQSNYYWGAVRNDLEWGIASYQETPTNAAAFLTDGFTTRLANDFYPATKKVGQALGGLGLEGGEYGPYQGYYMGGILLPSLASSGRDAWTETDNWKGAVLNRIYMTPPQPTVTVSKKRSGWDTFGFSDDEDWQNGSPAQATEVGTFMQAAADRFADSNLGKWARRWLNDVKPLIDNPILSTTGSGTWIDYGTLPLDYYDGGPRYLAGRSDWTSNGTAYLWQMGDHYSDGHSHADWGQFQIHRKGRWLTRETVGYTESVAAYGGSGSQPLNTGYAHNVPFINGAPGISGQGFPPDSWSVSPLVKRLESKAAYSYGDVDLTGVYHTDGGNNAATHVEREYWFLRDIETFVVFDRLQSDTAARSRTFVFHCETNPMLADPTHTLCVNGDQQLAVTTLIPTAPSSRMVIDESKGVSDPPPTENTQYRVEINDMPNATASYTLHVLQAMDASGTRLAPTVTDSSPGNAASGTFTVTIDGNHSLVIQKGMTSSGGSITISGTTTPLRADVQPFALGTDGTPAWGN